MIYSLSPKKIGNKIYIHHYLKRDLQGFTALLTNVLNEFSMELDPEFDSDLNDLSTYYGGERDCLLIAEADGEVVGSCAVKEHEPRVGEIRKLYVLNKFRGIGLGKRLLDGVIDFSKEHNYEKLYLTTDKQFTVASKLYKSRGFKVVKDNNLDIFMEKII